MTFGMENRHLGKSRARCFFLYMYIYIVLLPLKKICVIVQDARLEKTLSSLQK